METNNEELGVVGKISVSVIIIAVGCFFGWFFYSALTHEDPPINYVCEYQEETYELYDYDILDDGVVRFQYEGREYEYFVLEDELVCEKMEE